MKLSMTVSAALLAILATSAAADDAPLYSVSEGNKVDAKTYKGWQTWRAMACERCHGAEQQGMVGPSLVNSLKTLSKDQFEATVLNGRVDKGMPNFSGSQQVRENIENLYAYLKGRSDGAIRPGKLQAMEK